MPSLCFCAIISTVIIMELLKRKPIRLKNYDYSSTGVYFITVCAYKRKQLFWNNVGTGIARPQEFVLSPYGHIVDNAIQNISKKCPAITVDKYVIMPNHIHLLLQIHSVDGRPMVAPTISTAIQQMKGYVTKQIGFPVWQKRFQDHIIRNENDYIEIWQYIENNPIKWKEDCFYYE